MTEIHDTRAQTPLKKLRLFQKLHRKSCEFAQKVPWKSWVFFKKSLEKVVYKVYTMLVFKENEHGLKAKNRRQIVGMEEYSKQKALDH